MFNNKLALIGALVVSLFTFSANAENLFLSQDISLSGSDTMDIYKLDEERYKVIILEDDVITKQWVFYVEDVSDLSLLVLFKRKKEYVILNDFERYHLSYAGAKNHYYIDRTKVNEFTPVVVNGFYVKGKSDEDFTH